MKQDNFPRVSVLLAVYNPNETWLRELLLSLNAQTYENTEVLIWDDCPEHPVRENIFAQTLTDKKYTLFRGETNLGSNGAFEELTRRAKGKYLAYCDQDDIWCEHKVEVMAQKLGQTGSPLVYSDMFVIDAQGRVVANTIKKVHKRQEFMEGAGLAKHLVVRNFIMGCAMMTRADVAQSALPFEKNLVHDEWIAINAALAGNIELIKQPLLYYRKHSSNQTGVLMGVTDKNSYYTLRILMGKAKTAALMSRMGDGELGGTLNALRDWYDARAGYFNTRDRDCLRRMKTSDFGGKAVVFERYIPYMPEIVFKLAIKLLKKGIL